VYSRPPDNRRLYRLKYRSPSPLCMHMPTGIYLVAAGIFVKSKMVN
jgi:hypothetical protein